MHKTLKILLISLLAFLLVLVGAAANNITNIKLNKEGKTQQTIEKEEKKTENIVFLGDSITEIYPLEDIFGKVPIVKSGISGYRTKDILEQLRKMVYQYNPSKVILLIGTNDYLDDSTPDEVASNIKEIVQEIHKHRKNTEIYIESIYPINKNLKKEMVANRDNDKIIETNKKIKDICKEKNLTYIDMYNELIDEDGNFNKKYTYDGLHPNTLGYARISQVLSQYIYKNKKDI
jgi:lysophospholipase L1-like esterase